MQFEMHQNKMEKMSNENLIYKKKFLAIEFNCDIYSIHAEASHRAR